MGVVPLPMPPPPIPDKEMKWICDFCETDNGTDNKRCTECGAPPSRRYRG